MCETCGNLFQKFAMGKKLFFLLLLFDNGPHRPVLLLRTQPVKAFPFLKQFVLSSQNNLGIVLHCFCKFAHAISQILSELSWIWEELKNIKDFDTAAHSICLALSFVVTCKTHKFQHIDCPLHEVSKSVLTYCQIESYLVVIFLVVMRCFPCNGMVPFGLCLTHEDVPTSKYGGRKKHRAIEEGRPMRPSSIWWSF